jgi:hypothetical protein
MIKTLIINEIKDISKLHDFLKVRLLSCGFLGIVTEDYSSYVLSETELSQEELDIISSLSEEVIILATETQEDRIKSVVRRAIDFGNSLTLDFATENVMLGITQAGKTKLIADTCQQAFYYLSTGSLYEARTEMLAIVVTEEMAPFLTTARRLAFVNKIETYLGIPLST